MSTVDAVVVGSGPNGLAAAVTLARAGLEVVVLEAQPTAGGGARTLDLGLAPGIVHDLCAAVHPLALASPFLRAFDLAARGVELRVPEASYAHPLDGARAGVAWHDLDRTVHDLGPDGAAWRRLLAPLLAAPDAVAALALGDRRSLPPEVRTPAGLRAAVVLGLRALAHGTHPGAHAASPGIRSASPFVGDVAPALLAGVAAHAIAPQPGLVPAATGLLLATLGHAGGWPVPVGGSRAITDALLADLLAHGGRVLTGTPVTTWRELPRARTYLLSTTPEGALSLWGDRLPPAVRRRFAAFRYGDGAAKVDLVLSEPVPWRAADVARAGTVHLGGSREEVWRAEREVATGRHAERPVVLVSDPGAIDSSRVVDGLRPLWTYAHVPHGSQRDVTADVVAQIERFAPGFRDVVVASRCVPASELARHDANLVGGDIAAGAMGVRRLLGGPAGGWNPHAVGIPGVYLCSAATPPGPGVHGMSGWHAARRALRERFGIREAPSLGLSPASAPASPPG